MMKTLHGIFSFVLILFAYNSASCQQSPAGNELQIFASGLSSPVCITNAGDSRLFVIEQTGYIRIVDSTGNLEPQPFLDIHERVSFGGERGLLGLAFHPDYGSNGYFYVNYTDDGGDTRISRFSVMDGLPDLADPGSEFNILTIDQPFSNHNGGDLNFGPDGYLYIGMGDGGSAGDPGNRSQDPMDLLGKMLRIDINAGNPYAIPITNPFFNNPDTLGEIWALGLRNPWRFSFDRLTGDLWNGDVGQNAFEEINMQPAASSGGENYGWRCYEGNQEYNTSGCPAASVFTFPVFAYPHGSECSVTGGFVYRGSANHPYYGHYFFADYCSGRIWTLVNLTGDWNAEEYGHYPGISFSAFGEDSAGQLYIAGLNNGTIYRVTDNSTGVNERDDLPEIKIIQLPFSGKVRIESSRNDNPLINLSLYDVKGTVHLTDSTRNNSFEIDISGHPAGMYFLRVEIEGKYKVQKVLNF